MKTTIEAKLMALLGSAVFATVTTAGLASWMAVSAERASPMFAAASKVGPQEAARLATAVRTAAAIKAQTKV